MEKHRKHYAEFRFYEKPYKEPVLALMGDDWIRDYGVDIDYLHFHNLTEIGFCIRGKGKIVLNKEESDYESGTCTFIPYNFLHTTNSESTCHWAYIFFDIEGLLEKFFQTDIEKRKEVLRLVHSEAILFSKESDPFLCELIKMILDEMEKKEAYYIDRINGLLFAIIMKIASKIDGSSQSVKKDNYCKVAQALMYVSYHYDEEIKVADLASCCHLSETHFRRIFQEDMGMTPVEYINLSKIQVACDIMRKENRNMEEVAEKVGYSMSTFNRNFKQIMGVSPYQWKKQNDQKAGNLAKYHISTKQGWK